MFIILFLQREIICKGIHPHVQSHLVSEPQQVERDKRLFFKHQIKRALVGDGEESSLVIREEDWPPQNSFEEFQHAKVKTV